MSYIKKSDYKLVKTNLSKKEVKELLLRLENDDPTLTKKEDIMEILKAIGREIIANERRYKAFKKEHPEMVDKKLASLFGDVNPD